MNKVQYGAGEGQVSVGGTSYKGNTHRFYPHLRFHYRSPKYGLLCQEVRIPVQSRPTRAEAIRLGREWLAVNDELVARFVPMNGVGLREELQTKVKSK